MYTQPLPEILYTTTLVHIKYDCCGKEHSYFWKNANINFQKNGGKHICRSCWLKSDDGPGRRRECREKGKKTSLERYGVTVAMNQKHLIEERKGQYKDEEWLSKRNEKTRETSMERYGVEHPTQAPEVIEKKKETMVKNWGVEYPQQNEEIKARTKETCLEKYGVEYPPQSPEVK